MMNGDMTQLTIHNAGPQDAGWYQCSAVSVAGTATTRAKVGVEQLRPQPPKEIKLIIPRKRSTQQAV